VSGGPGPTAQAPAADALARLLREVVGPRALQEAGSVLLLAAADDVLPAAAVVRSCSPEAAVHVLTSDAMTLEALGDGEPGIVALPGNRSAVRSLAHLVDAFEFDYVLDLERVDGAEQVRLFEYLYPALAAGSWYVCGEPAEAGPPGYDQDLGAVVPEPTEEYYRVAVGASRYFDRFAHLLDGTEPVDPREPIHLRYLVRGTEVLARHGAAVALRRASTVLAIRSRGLAELGARTHLLAGPVAYPRLPARIVGAAGRRVWPVRDAHYLEGTASSLPVVVGELEDVDVVKSGFPVVDRRHVVTESLYWRHDHHVLGPLVRGRTRGLYNALGLAPARVLAEDAVSYVLLKQTHSDNYGHWIVDVLPKMQGLLELFDLSTLRFLVSATASAEMQQVYVDSLAQLGVPSEHVLPLEDTNTRVSRLVYPAPITNPLATKSLRSMRWLERYGRSVARSRDEGAQDPVKLYVSRAGYFRRRLTNEEEVVERVVARGYQVVSPERLPFDEQVSLFTRASHVVGPMGAGVTNLVFSPPRVRLFALATQEMTHDYFYDLVCLKGGVYLGQQGRSAGDRPDQSSDFTIDVGVFEQLLEDFDRPVQQPGTAARDGAPV